MGDRASIEREVQRRFNFFVCVLFVLLALMWFGKLRRNKDFTKVPLSQCEYLRDVSEPITMLDGMSFDDGGSVGLRFKDAKQVERSVCLINDLDDNKNLSLGNFFPSKNRVPIGGREEQAFLGLLQRWCRQDREAQEWLERADRWSRSDQRESIFTGDETDQQRAKAFAVGMMRKLLKRN